MKLKPAVIVLAALFVLAPLVVPSWILFILIKALFMFIAVLGVTMYLRGGQVTFGHALFYAAGTYTVGFSVKWFGFREILVLIPVGAVAGLLLAALVGLILARYRGVFFAMLNMAFSIVMYAVLIKLYWFTGGTDGLATGVATLAGIPIPSSGFGFYYFSVVIAGIATYVVYRFLSSPVGYMLTALGENEIRIEYTGESARRVLYLTYLLAGALAGVSGVLAAFTIGHVVPEDAYWIQSGEFVFVALLGGFESVAGALMGAVAFEFIQTYTSKFFPHAWQLVVGSIMLLVILFRPGGLFAIYESLVHWLKPKKKGIAHE